MSSTMSIGEREFNRKAFKDIAATLGYMEENNKKDNWDVYRVEYDIPSEGNIKEPATSEEEAIERAREDIKHEVYGHISPNGDPDNFEVEKVEE